MNLKKNFTILFIIGLLVKIVFFLPVKYLYYIEDKKTSEFLPQENGETGYLFILDKNIKDCNINIESLSHWIFYYFLIGITIYSILIFLNKNYNNILNKIISNVKTLNSSVSGRILFKIIISIGILFLGILIILFFLVFLVLPIKLSNWILLGTFIAIINVWREK
jgi:hypothetical protein